MPAASAPAPRLWASVLGMNLWMVAVALPLVGLFGGGQGAAIPPGGIALLAVLALLGPVALAVGVVRRSAGLLVGLYPLLVALPLVLVTAGASPLVSPPPLLALGASLVGFVVVALRALDDAAPAPARTQRLAEMVSPPRWRRRARVYRALEVAAGLFPLVLIVAVDLAPGVRRGLEARFGGEARAVQAALTVVAALLSVAAFRVGLTAPLVAHLSAERALQRQVDADRRAARRGRPRALFFVWVAAALVAMAVMIALRAGGRR
jgi:hypothetical protein